MASGCSPILGGHPDTQPPPRRFGFTEEEVREAVELAKRLVFAEQRSDAR